MTGTWIAGGVLWITSVGILYFNWGWGALLFGLFFMGIGVVPVAWVLALIHWMPRELGSGDFNGRNLSPSPCCRYLDSPNRRLDITIETEAGPSRSTDRPSVNHNDLGPGLPGRGLITDGPSALAPGASGSGHQP